VRESGSTPVLIFFPAASRREEGKNFFLSLSLSFSPHTLSFSVSNPRWHQGPLLAGVLLLLPPEGAARPGKRGEKEREGKREREGERGNERERKRSWPDRTEKNKPRSSLF